MCLNRVFCQIVVVYVSYVTPLTTELSQRKVFTIDGLTEKCRSNTDLYNKNTYFQYIYIYKNSKIYIHRIFSENMKT